MKLEQAKAYLGNRYVLARGYRPQPQHSVYVPVDIASTFRRVRSEMGSDNVVALARHHAQRAVFEVMSEHAVIP